MVLEKVSQEDIFAYILKADIDCGRKYTAPYRADNNPGCHFRWHNDVLFFCDFANVGQTHFTCFQLWQKVFRTKPEFLYADIYNKVTEFAYGPSCSFSGSLKPKRRTRRSEIKIIDKPFGPNDLSYWSEYGITEKQLKNDMVKSIEAFMIDNGDSNYSSRPSGLAFAYTEFQSGHIKIYQPHNKKEKWYSNCGANDIGGLNSLRDNGNLLIVTKSYKDCRVLRNLGYDSIWFQNEGTCPDKSLCKQLADRFGSIAVFYDNDETGIKASNMICKVFGMYSGSTTCFHLPERLHNYKIKDPSDFVRRINYYELDKFIKKNI